MYEGYQGYRLKIMNNTFKILNEGEISILKYKDYQMKPDYVIEFERQMDICKQVVNAICTGNNDYIKATTREEITEMNELYTKWEKIEIVSSHFFHENVQSPKDDKIIARLMGEKPFEPCIMINISPNWKGEFGKDKLTDKLMIKKFKLVIESYLLLI